MSSQAFYLAKEESLDTLSFGGGDANVENQEAAEKPVIEENNEKTAESTYVNYNQMRKRCRQLKIYK